MEATRPARSEKLLIVPEGIEIPIPQTTPGFLLLLLIVPEGIEMGTRPVLQMRCKSF